MKRAPSRVPSARGAWLGEPAGARALAAARSSGSDAHTTLGRRFASLGAPPRARASTVRRRRPPASGRSRQGLPIGCEQREVHCPARRREVKAKHDPENVFRHYKNNPASEAAALSQPVPDVSVANVAGE